MIRRSQKDYRKSAARSSRIREKALRLREHVKQSAITFFERRQGSTGLVATRLWRAEVRWRLDFIPCQNPLGRVCRLCWDCIPSPLSVHLPTSGLAKPTAPSRRRALLMEGMEPRQLLAIDVAVVQDIGSGNTSGFVATRDQLNNDTYFDFNAVLVSSSQVDSAAELAAFDVVVVGNNGYSQNDAMNNLTFQSALRSWVETSGGGVVMTGWGIYGNGDNSRTRCRRNRARRI